MKNILLLLTLITLVFTSCSTNESSQPKEEWLFVQTAIQATLTNSSLVIPVTNDIFAFTDRPYRDYDYLNGEQFASFWDNDETNSFKLDPPNAVLTWVDGNEVKELELVITDADFNRDTTITYTINYDLGIIAEDLVNISLFVDVEYYGRARQRTGSVNTNQTGLKLN
tara:strand:- start:1204 stop:1707 length:504 start_codon:yes stop_codon:yes gene_type:complete